MKCKILPLVDGPDLSWIFSIPVLSVPFGFQSAWLIFSLPYCRLQMYISGFETSFSRPH